MRRNIMNTRKQWDRYGLYTDTYSPGDGVTRYRFFTSRFQDYFAGKGIYTAMGWKEACVFAEGWIAAINANFDGEPDDDLPIPDLDDTSPDPDGYVD